MPNGDLSLLKSLDAKVKQTFLCTVHVILPGMLTGTGTHQPFPYLYNVHVWRFQCTANWSGKLETITVMEQSQ